MYVYATAPPLQTVVKTVPSEQGLGLIKVFVVPMLHVTVQAAAAAAAAPLAYVSVVTVGKVTLTVHAPLSPQTVTSGNTILTRLDVTAADDCHEFEMLKRRRE